jgi:F-type H+-transporting ATPase subunit delta
VTSSATSFNKPASPLATRYARALYDLAVEKGQLEAVEADFNNLKAMLKESAELRYFMASPLLSRKSVASAMKAIGEQAKMSTLTQPFFASLSMNGRVAVLPEIVDAFFNLAATKRGEVTAQVTTAHALSSELQEAIAGALQQAMAGKGVKKVRIAPLVDKSVLGGMRVQIGSSLFDGTLKGKLEKMAGALR